MWFVMEDTEWVQVSSEAACVSRVQYKHWDHQNSHSMVGELQPAAPATRGTPMFSMLFLCAKAHQSVVMAVSS